MQSKCAQITVFVIIAIVIVAAAIGIFVFRDKIFPSGGGGEFAEVYDYFDSCIEANTKIALSMAGTQAGYIKVPDFEPGNEYAPFSSQMDFLGNPVPYWYYVSSNGVIKEQVPSIFEIEMQIEDYLNEEIPKCDFSSLREKGYVIELKEIKTNVNIKNSKVDVSVNGDLYVEKADSNAVKKIHEVSVSSKFGEFYSLALDIYDKEKKDMFLENYAIDVMYNYAPVTGSELSCSPMTWNAREVVQNIRTGLSANIGALKTNSKKTYFDIGINSDKNVNFLYDAEWPSRIEIWPADGNILIAEPVGLDSGMGILGFCYVPYHFVYDIYFPTLIQIYDEETIFQFPVAVVIDKSVPRNALEGETPVEDSSLDEFCNYKNTNIKVYTYDNELNPVEADVDFICLNQKCAIGKTKIAGNDAVLSKEFPQCINGKIIARAEGYSDAEYYISTNEPGTANVLLDKKYELNLDMVIGGMKLENNGIAIVNFEGEKYKKVTAYPEQTKIKLIEDYYNISVQVFSGSTLKIPASSSRQCVEVPASGLFGVFGKTNEECFEIELPAQTLDNALSAGGKTREYILENDLKSGKITLSVPKLPSPISLEQVQQNYELINTQNIGVRFG